MIGWWWWWYSQFQKFLWLFTAERTNATLIAASLFGVSSDPDARTIRGRIWRTTSAWKMRIWKLLIFRGKDSKIDSFANFKFTATCNTFLQIVNQIWRKSWIDSLKIWELVLQIGYYSLNPIYDSSNVYSWFLALRFRISNRAGVDSSGHPFFVRNAHSAYADGVITGPRRVLSSFSSWIAFIRLIFKRFILLKDDNLKQDKYLVDLTIQSMHYVFWIRCQNLFLELIKLRKVNHKACKLQRVKYCV